MLDAHATFVPPAPDQMLLSVRPQFSFKTEGMLKDIELIAVPKKSTPKQYSSRHEE